jgi:hypothetical protein
MKLSTLFQMRDEIHRIQSDLESSELRRITLGERLKDINKSITIAQGTIKYLDELLFMRNQIPEAIAKAQAAEQDVSNLKASISNLADEIRQLREQAESDPSAAAQLRIKIKEMEIRVEELRKAESLLEAANARVQELTIFSNKIPEAEKEAANARALINKLTTDKADLEARVEDVIGHIQLLRDKIKNSSEQYQKQLDSLIENLDNKVPLALLPVRLETRFAPRLTGNGKDLLIRIYPDDIHQDTHEPELTDDEINWGKNFWNHYFEPLSKYSDRLQAWRQLAGRFGQARGAWIAREMQPETGAFPTPATRPNSWTRASHTKVLPDRWVALGYLNVNGQQERVFKVWGDLVPHPLITGPSPKVDSSTSASLNATAGIDEGSKWMINFEEAVKVGMGIRVPLTSAQEQEPLKLVVLGVKATMDSNESAMELQSLFDTHHYTWGLGFVPQGTLTNNTEQIRSGHTDHNDLGYKTSFDLEFPQNTQNRSFDSDGDLASNAFGLESQTLGGSTAFSYIPHSGNQDQYDAQNINTVMWPATWGYFLTQLMYDTFTDIKLDALRQYFIKYVRARGPLPALRVGNQPYGILPVTSLDYWRSEELEPEIIAFSIEDIGDQSQDKLRIAWDLKPDGTVNEQFTGQLIVPSSNDLTSKGGGIAIADLDDNKQPDIIVFRVGTDSNNHDQGYLLVGRNLGASGNTASWSQFIEVPGFHDDLNLCSSIAIADLDDNKQPDIIVFRVDADNIQRGIFYGYLYVGFNLNIDGQVSSWSNPVHIFNNLSDVRGAGIAVADLDNNGLPDIVLLYVVKDGVQNKTYLRIGRDLDRDGNVTGGWTAPLLVTDLGPSLSTGEIWGADITVINSLSEDSKFDIILHYIQDSSGQRYGYLQCGHDLDINGNIKTWTRVIAQFALDFTGVNAGIEVASIGRSTSLDLSIGSTALVNLLVMFRSIWRKSLADLPYAGRSSDPDKDLMKMLGMEAITSTFTIRKILGRIYTDNLWWFLNKPLGDQWWNKHNEMSKKLLMNLKLLWNPRLAEASFASTAFDFQGPLVEDDVSETDPLKDNYIGWLRRASPRDIHDQIYPTNSLPNSLLYRILRHATLLAYTNAAFLVEPVDNHRLDDPRLIKEPELIDLADITRPDPVTPLHTLTSWRHLIEDKHNREPIDVYLHKLDKFDTPELSELGQFLGSLNELRNRPSAALERLLGESLDLSSHRLDAWITSIATQRLWSMRSDRQIGIQLGGYGFVEDLRPSGATTNNQSAGFIHAPSLAHATTAAVLYSGYLSHNDTPKGNLLAIDLSSHRVRLALWLIEGVRQGQALGALLGYLFERSLHEKKLDIYVNTFRQVAPLSAGKLIQTADAIENIAANNVVDGLALLRRWQKGNSTTPAVWNDSTIPFGKLRSDGTQFLPKSGDTGYEDLIRLLTELEDAVDAISDTMIAESTYQAVQGNYLRSGASLDAISRGEVPSQDLEVIRTPRSGIGVTHRLIVMFNENPDPNNEFVKKWESSVPLVKTLQVRAQAEPILNAWVAMLLGDPQRVLCKVEYMDPKTHQLLVPPRIISLKELDLCPLDILYCREVNEKTQQRSELEERLIYYAIQTRPVTPVEVPPDSSIRLIFSRDAAWDTTSTLIFPEFLEVVRAIRDLVTSARPINARDISLPGTSLQPGTNVSSKLKKRSDDAIDSLTEAHSSLRKYFSIKNPDDLTTISSLLNIPENELTNLSNLLDLPRNVDLEAVSSAMDIPSLSQLDSLRMSLMSFSYFGIQRSIPLSVSGSTAVERSILLAQSRSVAEDVNQMLAKINSGAAATDNDYLSNLKTIFDASFQILPPFESTKSSPELQKALDRRVEVNDVPSEEVITWFQHISNIRDGSARLQTLAIYTEAIGDGSNNGIDLKIAQLPVEPKEIDRWVGIQSKSGNFLGGRLSLVIHLPTDFQIYSTTAIAGLLIDEWVEVIPNKNETTAITFQYDAPGARAPQAILLAVPPDINRPWNLDILEAIVLETLELAKLRTVDVSLLRDVGHFLPALYFAYNVGGDPNGDTVSTDFH